VPNFHNIYQLPAVKDGGTTLLRKHMRLCQKQGDGGKRSKQTLLTDVIEKVCLT
jgi:hypothetical protein